MLQASKFIRVFFAFFFLAILLLTYGYLPLTININIDGFGRVGREFFFYACIGLFIFFNLITYFFRYLADRTNMGYYQKTIIHLLPSVLYFSFILLIGYLGTINNAPAMNSSSYGYLTYLSSALLIIWIFAFLFTLLKKV
ncbi:MAG: hypothetical protein GY816_07630 [Cytophagales bacterium]|nr:hypothetical protein [Cytophagales bacterium]